ncbi:MAG: 3-deoxy-7-phosphoheptulonate synthase [Armatimonadetes bacterium]|nr:3-deoxy-7-phosphoheptulonate synthase [Armatimonadota bacterium]
MIIVMQQNASSECIDAVIQEIDRMGFKSHPIFGVERTVVGVIGDKTRDTLEHFEQFEGVERVLPILQPYKFAGREVQQEETIIEVGNVRIGGARLCIIAGPCSVESESQIMSIALAVKESGADMLRGGAFKPRTSPYSFKGLREEGLRLLAAAREATGLPVVTEVMDARHVEAVYEYADMLQVGARNMQNFTLLEELGKIDKPVFLKRGPSATIEDLLMAAEYIIAEGNRKILLCERGLRTFETATRNTFDVSAIPVLQRLSHLPVFADPSHGGGHWWLVDPLSRAAVAAGADGLMVEVHDNPKTALSDGPQSLTPKNFTKLVENLKSVAAAVGRSM